jgi:hypothetical protein
VKQGAKKTKKQKVVPLSTITGFLEQKNLTKIVMWHKLDWLNIYFIDHEGLDCSINC